MSNILTNSLETKSYTLFLNSTDKTSGTNNNATFNVNWDAFLPREYDSYKMTYSFQTGGGNYKDASTFIQLTGTANITGALLTLTGTFTNALKIGMYITGNNITAGTYIVSFGTGTGGVGTYAINTNYSTPIVGSLITSGNLIFSGCRINCNLKGRSYSYDSTTSSGSNILGYAQRDIQTGTTSSNSFSAFYLQYPPKTISRPTENQLTISLYNLNYLSYSTLLYDTDTNGNTLTDSTPWNIIIEFIPVLSAVNSYNKK